ncbi:response regulator [Collimonas sp. H4R21]|jgi:CheY-like chemotaxis protein|uniref:Response regulator n=1 Tax=Collimonas rhizosphaerae TaxID=3126357 RepID=A0ABU9Q0E9_9BURK|nr:response regulator [Collimonas sp. OK412]SFB75872.1 Response regulator receiver domain-containing protein [Collimonas sp. OK412]
MKNILVVDDNPLNSNLARIILTRAGHTVHVFAGASEALRYLEKNTVDVVLTDVGMRDINGKEFCRLVKDGSHEVVPRMVAYTAFAMEEELLSIRAAGFDAVVIKPATRVQILAAVDPAS